MSRVEGGRSTVPAPNLSTDSWNPVGIMVEVGGVKIFASPATRMRLAFRKALLFPVVLRYLFEERVVDLVAADFS